MRTALMPLLLFTVACASSSGGSAATSTKPATQTISGAGIGSLTVRSTTEADLARLPYAPDAVWRVLPSIFDSLGIPVTELNQTSRQIGNTGYKIRQRLGKVSLSRYLDCGSSQIGPNADSYDVFLTVLTTVAPAGDAASTALSTVVDAQSRPATYNQAYSHCSSKGGIEKRITDLVAARLSR
ncbi:MAG: hypothetical protein ABJB66_04495 [Gemmatimonadaceae bacterium]